MEPRCPSDSSALQTRRHEIRRRSGQASSAAVSSDESVPSSSSRWPATHHPEGVPSTSEDNPHRPRNTGDVFLNTELIAQSLAVDYPRSPTIKLVSQRENGSEDTRFQYATPESSNNFTNLRLEAPLPPLPEEVIWENHNQTDNENCLSLIPLTPRPDGPPRLPSQASQESKTSRRSILSLFPRLPTPDFTTLGRNPLKRATSPSFDYLPAHVANSVSVTPTCRSNAHSGSNNHSTDTFKSSSVTCFTPAQPRSSPPVSWRAKSFESLSHSTVKSNTVCNGELSSLFETVPTRFTRKFPSPASASSFCRSISSQGTFEGMVASESGNDLGLESIGRWTCYKWVLLLSVSSVFVYAVVGLVSSILTWFGARSHADVLLVADSDILIFITVASTLLLLTGLVGLSGTLLNSRPILAFYALLLWPSFVSILVVGYTSYKREAFSLDRKLNMAWSQWYDDWGRLLIQESLHCCGFYNPLHEATFSKNCYPRTPLPGCKGKLFRFEKENLRLNWRLAFSLVPLHVLNIFVSLLCSNHVDRRFGKGLTPRAYRLRISDVRANADLVLARFRGMKLPGEPLRSLSHVTDREDRPAISRTPYEQGQAYEAIGESFLRADRHE